MKKTKFLLVALLSLSLIALEMTWTRILSAEFFYTFAFLVLSLAILGLGMGALTLRLAPGLNREKLLGPMLSLTGLMTVLGPFLVFKLNLQFSQILGNWGMAGKLLLAILLLSSAFYFGGIALAIIFRNFHDEMDRLYMADLLGAGLGVVLGIWAMNLFSTPTASVLIVIPVLIAAIISSKKLFKIVPLALLVAAVLFSGGAKNWLKMERQERGAIIYDHWDAMGKIKLFAYPGDQGRGMIIDNVANSPVYKFDGDFNFPEGTPKDQWGIPVGDLIRRFDNCTFLSLGAGGGGDVLQALMEGATEVHAVEVNPWINKMLVEGDTKDYLKSYLDTLSTDLVDLPEYTSHLYRDPRVTVVSEDARAYIRRFENKFDIIYSLSSNTWSSLASGSFALAENYLFTTEAFKDYWNALSENGFMMMEHQFYMPRLVSEVMDALTELGVANPKAHFAVYNLPRMRRNALLLSKAPLTGDILQTALTDLSPQTFPFIHLLYPAADSLKSNPIQRIVDEGWQNVQPDLPIDISPNRDNRPFVAQLGMWKNFSFKKMERILPYEFFGFPLTKLIIVVILAVVLVIIVPLNLIPYLKKGPRLKSAPWFYYFLIGMAFMIVEVVLIQKYTLFVGPSVYSISTILLTLLVASGIGSRFSWKVSNALPFMAIFGWLLLDILVLGHLTAALGGLSQTMRILVTVLLVAPLGFFMGMPFPKAAQRVGELVDWGFAVNGAASVLGSTGIILVVMALGLNAGLLLGGMLYLAAFALLSAEKAW